MSCARPERNVQRPNRHLLHICHRTSDNVKRYRYANPPPGYPYGCILATFRLVRTNSVDYRLMTEHHHMDSHQACTSNSVRTYVVEYNRTSDDRHRDSHPTYMDTFFILPCTRLPRYSRYTQDQMFPRRYVLCPGANILSVDTLCRVSRAVL